MVLDLYQGRWRGERLGLRDCVISADEKTSIQARRRCHATLPPGPGRCRRVEHEYERGGAPHYLAKTGIEPFGRLVEQVMGQEPYRTASRVFRVVDYGSAHRGEASARRMLGCTATRPWCTRRCMRVGSTRWRSTSRWCNGKS